MSDLIFQIVGVICTIVGVLAIYFGLKAYRMGKESLQWPTVEGEIIATNIIERLKQSPGSSSKMMEWIPLIVYQYVLDGKKYVSTQINVSPQSWGSQKRAKKLVSKYHDGRLVRVSHHPTVYEASKFSETSKLFPKFVQQILSSQGLEIYRSLVSMAPVLIETQYTEDAKVGNAVLEPGASLGRLFGTLILGIVFAISGIVFLFVL